MQNTKNNEQKSFLDHAKQSATDSFKNSSRRVILKTAETISNLIVNKITNRTTKVSKKLQQNNLETSANLQKKGTTFLMI